MRIDRKEFIEELMLREHISKKLKRVMSKQRRTAVAEESELRKFVRSILKEAEDAEKAPHTSTGINVLADVLKKIIPVLEQDYKRLTTDPTQRESFRAHIINAAQNTIAPVAATSDSSGGTATDDDGEEDLSDDEMMELDEIEVVTGDEAEELEAGGDLADEEAEGEEDELGLDDEAFIDIDEVPDEEEDAFGLEGKDDTGRNFAQATFDKIEKQIIDAYALLGNDEDKELFYSYLVTNLKLYFDKFEDELVAELPEPTTPEYEDEKEDQDAADEEGEEAEAEAGEEDELGLGGDEEELGL
jgi:hypothetical protein